MKSKLFFNILSSGLQAIAVQILGGLFFYLLSLYLSKNDFGIIGWTNAVSMFLVTILSCGLEQVVVRRIASSKTSDWIAAAFLFHSFFSSVIMFLFLLAIKVFINNDSSIYHLLPLFFGAQAITYIATPLKQYLNAKEMFAPYGIIAIISNICKIVLIFVLVSWNKLSISGVLIILVVSALFELVGLIIYILLKPGFFFTFTFKFSGYQKLLKESMPQYISVIFDSSLNRIDWILLGILTTNAVTADYSFAYRAYEFVKLPMIILGPILLIKYSKLLSNNRLDEQKIHETHRLLALEMFLAVFILLLINISWSPFVGSITNGKYGMSNSSVFLIISLCLPLHFFINLLWTLSFAAKKYKQITKITMLIAGINLVSNLVLIPLYGGLGAAISYLLATLVQAIVYFRLVDRTLTNFSFTPLIILSLLGVCSYVVGILITKVFLLQLAVSLSLYILTGILSKQVRKTDFEIFYSYLKK